MLDPGGALLISVRDYAAIERRSPDVRSYGSRTEGDCRYSAEQTWRWDSRYYAVELPTLVRLVRETGFKRITRRDEHFFQPLLVAFNGSYANAEKFGVR